jgi:hypothetical protein
VGWGNNFFGQCVAPPLPPGLAYVDLEAGGGDWGAGHSLARRSDGALIGWGRNDKGQANAPALPPGSAYERFAAGGIHSVATYGPASPAPSVYCTAKVNSLGCTPSIAVVGLPSATAGVGCTVSTTNVIGHTSGMYFHGRGGAQAVPFHGGLLCVSGQRFRHPILDAGGTSGLCDGRFVEDFNAYLDLHLDAGLVPGASVWIQTWSRDSNDPFGDSLSDAVTMTIGL